MAKIPAIFHNVCFFELAERMRNSGNRNADDFRYFADRQLFMTAEEIANLEPRWIADHIKFLCALNKLRFVFKLFFDLLDFSCLHKYSNDNKNKKLCQY